MKKYNIQNYVRYKEEVTKKIKTITPLQGDDYAALTREELIVKFLPLVENLARKFSTSQQACGVMTILDLIQEGNYGLCKAVDRLDREILRDSEDQEKTI